MKNRKGFTLIEIIGAIVILGIIAIIAFATYTSNLREFRSNYYNKLERTIAKSGEEFFEDNRNYRPSGILLAQEVTLSTLLTKNYVSSVKDYNGDECSNSSYIMVIKEGRDKYSYHACLICDKDEYDNTQNDKYCDRTWLDPTKVEYGLGEMTQIYVFKGTTREELKELLELPVAYVRKNAEGEVIAEARGTGEGEPTISPNNIDVVNTNVVGKYTVEYEYKGKTEERIVTVYENEAPNVVLKKQQTKINKLDGTTKSEEEDFKEGDWGQNIVVKLNSTGYINTEVRTSRFQWNKDGRWQDFCETDPCEVKVTEEMNQVIKFRIVDTNGNISKETTPITFRIDNTKPKCTLTIPTPIGENDWYKTDVEIKFAEKIDQKKTNNESVVSGIQYYNIQESTEGIEKNKTIATVTQNQDTSGVTYIGFVIDKADNFATCSSEEFKRDATAPSCTNSGDSTTWTNGNRTIKWGCNDPKSNNSNSGCNLSFSGSEKTFTTTTKTSPIAAYIIKDMAGNQVTCPARTADVYVDKIAPSCTNSGDSTTYATSRTIYYGCDDDESDCNPSYSGGNSVFTSTTTTETIGSYVIKDNAGNTTPCGERTANVYVDTTPPNCTYDGDSTSWIGEDRTIYYGCSDDNVGCDPAHDGGNKVFSTTTETSTIPSYEIRDKLGNSRTCAARTANVYVDKTAPSCTHDGDSTTWTNTNRTIYYGCDDDESGCDPNHSGSSETFKKTTVTATITSYEIRDNVGNVKTCDSRTADVYVDKIAPKCTNSGDSTTYATSRTIYYGCDDDESDCNPSYSGGNSVFTSTTTTETIGSYVIKDNAGNTTPCGERTANVYVDATPPKCTNSGDSTTYATSRTIYYGCDDDDSGCDPNHNGSSETFTKTTVTATIAAYEIRDKAGNTTPCEERTANVYVDKTAPSCGTVSYESSTTSSCTVVVGCSDSHSDCVKSSYSVASQTDDGSITISDNVGNTNTCSYVIYTASQIQTRSCNTHVLQEGEACGGYNECKHKTETCKEGCGSWSSERLTCNSKECVNNNTTRCETYKGSDCEDAGCVSNTCYGIQTRKCDKCYTVDTTCTPGYDECRDPSFPCETTGWGNWSSWNDGECTSPTTTTDVNCRTVYRAKAK